MESLQGYDFHKLMWDANNTNYFAVSSLVLLVYDYLTSFREEVDLIWKSQWSVMKCIYLWNRYFALLTLGFNTSIRLREMETDKMYGSSFFSCIPYLEKQLEVVGYTYRLYLGSTTILRLAPYVHIGPSVLGCYSLVTVPKFYSVYPVPPLLVTLVMFLLTMYKCIGTLYGYRRHRMPIISLFLRDGVFWFLAIFAVGLPHMIISYVARPTLVTVMIGPFLAVYSIVASRALINVKQIMSSQPGEDGMYDSRVRTHLDFRSVTQSSAPFHSSGTQEES